MIVVLLGMGCRKSLTDQYERERSEVLAKETSAPKDWSPDLQLQISYDSLSEIGKALLVDSLGRGQVSREILGNTVKINLKNEIQHFKLSNAHKSDLTIDLKIKGNAIWSLGATKQKLPYTIKTQGKATIQSNAQGKLKLHIKQLHNMEISSKGNKLGLDFLKGWINKKIKEQKAFDLGSIDLKSLGLLDFNVEGAQHGVNVSLLSNVPSAAALTPFTSPLSDDWELRIAGPTLTTWVRRMAFEQGIISHGVAIDPYELSFQDNTFNMLLRLWKLEGFGQWWRDYEIQGKSSVKKTRVHLRGTKVLEMDKSNGAGLSDPLALLAESYLLKSLEEQLHYAVPSSTSSSVGGRRLVVDLKKLQGNSGYLAAIGSLELKTTNK